MRATARNSDVLGDIDEMLGGSGTSAFETVIRTEKAAAKDLREAHMTVTELVTASRGTARCPERVEVVETVGFKGFVAAPPAPNDP